MRHSVFILAVLVAASQVVAEEPKQFCWDLESAKVGQLPPDWTAAKTGEGAGSVWKVAEDASAPHGSKVLAQTAESPASIFNLCVATESSFQDGEITVAFKAVRGKVDQGGGIVWRYIDANNYYVARMNPLEDNYRLFKVVAGKRTQLATKDGLKVPAGEWHTLTIRQKGEQIDCELDGKKQMAAKDATFTKSGKVGLWTKADAQTYFDDLVVTRTATPLGAQQSPSKVLVVNTQDASVSVVDLAAMKELHRHPVGPRPYGIAVSQDGTTVAVGVEDEECVKFFSLPDFKLKGQAKIGKMFNDHIVLTQDGQHIMVANFYSDDVLGIGMESMKEEFRIAECSAPHVVKFGPQKKLAYVTCKKITGIAIIDPERRKLVKFMQLNVNPRSLTFSPDESKLYFGSFWVNGFYELDVESGKVSRLLSFDPPQDNAGNQEVTYHGVEALTDRILVAANEGRSYVDAVDVTTGKQLSRLSDVSKPCCVEKIPGRKSDEPVRFLISNIGDDTLQLAELSSLGTLKSLGKVPVGKAPKRVAFLP